MEKPITEYGHSCFIMVMISSNDGVVAPIGSVEVKSDSILIEPWMLEDVAERASRRLSWYAANNGKDKVVN